MRFDAARSPRDPQSRLEASSQPRWTSSVRYHHARHAAPADPPSEQRRAQPAAELGGRPMTQQPETLPEGTVTILFTDVVGSTELTNRLGDDEGRAALRSIEGLVREELAAHQGREVKGPRRRADARVPVSPPRPRVRARDTDRAWGGAARVPQPASGSGCTPARCSARTPTCSASPSTSPRGSRPRPRPGQVLSSETVRALLGSARDRVDRPR